jgi:hypothetical protein
MDKAKLGLYIPRMTMGGSGMVFEFACNQDMDSWMELLELVRDNFPGLDKKSYKKWLQVSIRERKHW